MKQIILTGASGFIGTLFVNELIRRNIDVIALGRKSLADLPGWTRQVMSTVNYVKIDMRNIKTLSMRLKQSGLDIYDDCVFFNLAWGGIDQLSDLNIRAQMNNVSYTVNAVHAASEIGCKKFVQVGTMEEAFTLKYLNLDHKHSSFYNRHVLYSVAKLAAKNASFTLSNQLGLDFNYVLHSHVMGPGDKKDSFLQVTLQKLIDKEDLIFSSGEQYFDVISPDDCALGYYLISMAGKHNETYWVGSGEPRPLRHYVEEMYELYPSGKPMQFGMMPYNDIVLDPDDFSISNLVRDTGYAPSKSYSEIVTDLYNHLLAGNL